jgi:putative ABC transport system permease protein
VFAAAEVNVMNLLLARAAARRRELAIRVAIGASRGRLLQQLVTETGVLAAAGGAAGLVLASWVTAGLGAVQLPGNLPVRFDFHADTRVVMYALALTFVTAATTGVLAARRASRVDVDAALRNRGREAARRRGVGIRGALVIAQTAACFVLLVAAAMFSRSLSEARQMDLGFDPRGVLNVQMDVAHVGYSGEQAQMFYEEVERRVRRLPGVSDLSYAFSVPMGYVTLTSRVAAEGQRPDGTRLEAGMNIVGPDYFAVMSIPILQGRTFDARDTPRAPRVAVVNAELAKALWPGQDPIGRRFTEGPAEAPLVEVVGLAGTSKYRLLFEEPQPYFYVPVTQHDPALRVLHVRTATAPESLAPAIERTIHELEPALPLYDVQSMTNALEGGRGFFLVRTAAMFAAVLGAVAAALAIVGLYGVVSCMASDRSREIGIRLALGATARNVARVVLVDGALLAVAGTALGAVAAFAVARLLAGLLFGVAPTDPISFLAAGACLAAVTVIATSAPAVRAMRTDPISALRECKGR